VNCDKCGFKIDTWETYIDICGIPYHKYCYEEILKEEKRIKDKI
jgi:hypothetical protein